MNSYGLLILGFIVVFSLLDFWIEFAHIKRLKDPLSKDVDQLYSSFVYERYKKNERKRFVLSTIKTAIRLLVFLFFALLGAFTIIDELIKEFVSIGVLVHTLFIGGYFFIIFILDCVVDIGDELTKGRKKITKAKLKKFTKIIGRKLMIMFGFGGLGILVSLLLYQGLDTLFFVVLFILIELVLIIFSLFFTSIIVPIFYKLTPLQEGELREQIHIFLRQEGYQIDDVYVLNQGRRSSNMNAFVSGFSSRKRIVLFDTLLKNLSNDEVVAVIAHELGHQKKGHLLFNLGLSTVLIGGFVLGLYVFIASSFFPTSFGFDGNHLGFSLLLYIYVLDIYLLLARMVLSINSRKFEYQADNYAKDIWYKESLSSALLKIAKKNIEHLTPHPIYAMIYFTHPSLNERLKHLLKEEQYE